MYSAKANPAYDQIPLCTVHVRQAAVRSKSWTLVILYEDVKLLFQYQSSASDVSACYSMCFNTVDARGFVSWGLIAATQII